MCNITLTFFIFSASCILLWFGFSGFKNNRVLVKGGYYIERLASPINYWLNVVVYFVVGIGGICFSFFMASVR